MSQKNPLDALLSSYESAARCVQTHLSQFFPFDLSRRNSPLPPPLPSPQLFPLSAQPTATPTPTQPDVYALLLQRREAPSDPASPFKGKTVVPLTKEELGRSTWTLLHTIAGQYPDHPTRQQKRDIKELMAIISRVYPCKECADHFKEILKANPVQAGSQDEFSQWLCHVHNVVNRSLGKLTFSCQRVNARWGKLDCQDGGCDLEGTSDASK